MKNAYQSTLESLKDAQAHLEEFCARENVGENTAYAMDLSLDEIFTNSVMYGHKEDASGKIEVECETQDGFMLMTLSDDAPPFNPFTDAADPDITASIEERGIGGLGIYFVKKMMDGADYERVGGKNVIKLKKRLNSDLHNE